MQRFIHRLTMAIAVLLVSRAAVAQYSFRGLDFPGAVNTDLIGFCGNTVVGDFSYADGNTHGWLNTKGVFSQYDVPGAWFTSLSAINHRGDFGGVYRNDLVNTAARHGFVVAKGVLTTIDYPGSARTSVIHMNDRGQLVGIARIPTGAPNKAFGFIWQDGKFTNVAFPGAFGTGLDGINENGDVCGFTQNEDQTTHAMMRLNNVFTSVEPPDTAGNSIALSINNRGQVSGWYEDAVGYTHGFIYYRGNFTIIDPPGSLGAEVSTVENNGEIAGDYLGPDGGFHGFIGTPAK